MWSERELAHSTQSLTLPPKMALVKPFTKFSNGAPRFGSNPGSPKTGGWSTLRMSASAETAAPAMKKPAKKAPKTPSKETLLVLRFYTIDFDEM